MISPEKIQATTDLLVASVHDGAAVPVGIQAFYEWVESNDWDSLISDLDEGMAINLKWLERSYFSDVELMAQEDVKPDLITDEIRVQNARQQIEAAKDSDDGVVIVTIHAYPIADRDGRTAVLGCMIEVHGQGGPAPCWQGVFRDRDHLLEHLHQEHVWLLNEADELPDAYLLSLWEKKLPRRSRQKQKAPSRDE